MNAEFALVRLKSINNKPQGKGSLAIALKHNMRQLKESETASYDATLSHLNFSLLAQPKTSEVVVGIAKQHMQDRGYRPTRKDSVVAVEGLFSLRQVVDVSDLTDYFGSCAMWLAERMQGLLLSAEVHLDESMPHCHAVVMLPLVNGGRSGSKFIGDKRQLGEHVADFHAKVASRYGLKTPQPNLSRAETMVASRFVHRYIDAEDEPAGRSVFWPFISRCIDRAPMDAAVYLPRHSGAELTILDAIAVLAASRGSGPDSEGTEAISNRRLCATWNQAEHGQAADTNAIDVDEQLHIDGPLPCVEVEVQAAVEKCK